MLDLASAIAGVEGLVNATSVVTSGSKQSDVGNLDGADESIGIRKRRC